MIGTVDVHDLGRIFNTLKKKKNGYCPTLAWLDPGTMLQCLLKVIFLGCSVQQSSELEPNVNSKLFITSPWCFSDITLQKIN